MRGKAQDAYHVYQIIVRISNEEWSVFRRYTHFYDLHKSVVGRMRETSSSFAFFSIASHFCLFPSRLQASSANLPGD